MNRYLFVVLCQLMQGMACTRFHVLEAQLARWLLMTRAASLLHDNGLIRYSRGDLGVLDPQGLELAACGCYAADRANCARVLNGSVNSMRPSGC